MYVFDGSKQREKKEIDHFKNDDLMWIDVQVIPLGNTQHRSDYFIFDMTKREITMR